MPLGILGDIHGYLPGSATMCIDFAVHLTATLAVDAFLQVGDLCHRKDEYCVLDTASWTLERFPSRSLA